MFLKRKQSGRMKGRECVDEYPRLKYITKEESSSPTVSLYALMGSCVMDTIEDRKVLNIYIPGVFLQGDWPQKKHPGYIMFEGIMVGMISENNPVFHDMIV